jgi:protein CpxP
MSSLFPRIPASVPFARSIAVAALLGATMLASPLTAARADGVKAAPIVLAQAASQTPAAAGATEAKPETVEQRITALHTSLKITSAEEPNWNGVAQAMRENAAAMQKLVADKMAEANKGMTAIDDLKTYEKFARAHVAGLKNLTSSFETLYNAMPDAQKKVADGVFQSFGREGAHAHG